jgi:hypothetical protein
MDSTERQKLAFSTASDACKQVLTLTTAIVTITIAFAKDLVKDSTPGDQIWLRTAWIAYSVSILAGILMLLALTGTAGSPQSHARNEDTIYRSNVRLPAAIQMISFAIGVVLTVAFGFFAL